MKNTKETKQEVLKDKKYSIDDSVIYQGKPYKVVDLVGDKIHIKNTLAMFDSIIVDKKDVE